MRRAIALLTIGALLAVPAIALAAEPFAAPLSGDSEVPPVETDATGNATVTINDAATEISFEVTFEGLSGDGTATMSHIHYGAADVAGPVMIWLTEVGVTDGTYSSPISGTAGEAEFTPVENGPQTFAEALQAIRDGMAYVNVHTVTNGGGEIRGQLDEIPDTAVGESVPTLSLGAPLALLLIAAAAAFLLTLRRFSLRRS